MTDPIWLQRARQYLGLSEVPGKLHNKQILKWWTLLKLAIRDDETAWCGGFVGGVLKEAGFAKTVANPAGARNWLDFGVKLTRPAYGCIVVFWRGKRSGWSGHVGFVVGEDAKGNLMVLGGNQGNAVTIKAFSKDRVLGYRWPGVAPYEERYTLPMLQSDGTLSSNEA